MSLAYTIKPTAKLYQDSPYGSVFSYFLRRLSVASGPEEINLDELMNRVKCDQCEVSFRAIFDHFYGRILGYFEKAGIKGHKSADLAQETLLAVWHKAAYFDPSKGSCATWIFTIARNIRYDLLRSLNRDVLSTCAEDIFALQLEDPLFQMDARILSDDIRKRINSLPDEQKDAIDAMYFKGYSHGEYAQMRKIPLGTVKSRVRLALSHIKKGLEEA